VWFTKKQHSTTTRSLICSAFPEQLGDAVAAALGKAGIAPHEPFVNPGREVRVDGELVSIPYRVYFPPAGIEDIEGLTATEQAIFASFMTRHHDGHQREYWARILCKHPSSWAAPYLAALLGDYVIQTLEAVRGALTEEWKPIMARYADENQISLRALNHRILNYWTIYYRYFSPNIRILTDYPGYRVAEELGLWDRRTAPKLLKKAKANKARLDNRP
jgi:hypothetical protein